MENTIFQQMEEHGPRACRFLNVEHHYHSSYQKSIIKRTIQYMKDRTECFDDYFPSKKDNDCKQMHVMNWLGLFVDMHNRAVMEKLLNGRAQRIAETL